MKTNSPLKTFKPFFCPAHTEPGGKSNIIVQLAAPYQFVATSTIITHDDGPPCVVIECYWNRPLPDSCHRIVAGQMHVELLGKIESFYPDLDSNTEYQVSDNRAQTCTLGPGFRFHWCESQMFGATHDTVLFPGPPWTLYAVDCPSEGDVVVAYSEEPLKGVLDELLIQEESPDTRPTITEVKDWYKDLIQNLTDITPEDLIN